MAVSMSHLIRPHCLLAIVVVALLMGCQTLPPPAPQPAVPPLPADEMARALREEGKLLEASNEYLRLANAVDPPEADSYRLEAAALLIEMHELEQANELLLQPLSPLASLGLQQRQRLLLATIALAENRPQAVLSILPEAVAEEVSAEHRAEAYRLRAQAYSELGQFIAAANEYVTLELILLDTEAIRANRQDLWQTLARAHPDVLSQYATAPPATLDGWIELAALSRKALVDPAAFHLGLDVWRARYPQHPAGEAIVPELITLSHGQTSQPRQIALLLPSEGPFASAAQAIRDGFVAAWFDDPSPSRPAITIHNTTSTSIPELHRKVVSEGADYVVGPLDKPSVAAWSQLPDLSVPTLALNYVPGDAAKPGSVDSPLPASETLETAKLYQFSLSPEAEAQEVAERAWKDGHRNAAVLFPEGSWGQRVGQAFAQTWSQLGGTVAASRVYPNDAENMAPVIRRLLTIDASEKRHQALTATLKRRLNYVPRRRQDIDFIFMAAFPREARQLVPQLRFYHAADVPVYATSHVFSGIDDPRADTDVDGITFGDMPWLLMEDGRVAQLRGRLKALWSDPLARYGRLYAFGLDAYRLVPYLEQLDTQPFVEFPGVTGTLVMNADRQFQRRLLWAQFRDGIPKLRAGSTVAALP